MAALPRDMLALVKIGPNGQVIVLDFRPDRLTAFPQLPNDEEQTIIESVVASAPERFAPDAVYELSMHQTDDKTLAQVTQLRSQTGVFLAATALKESDGTVTVSNLYCDTPQGKTLAIEEQQQLLQAAVSRAFESWEVGKPQKIYLSLAEVFTEGE